MARKFVIFAITLMFTLSAVAQTPPPSSTDEASSKVSIGGPRRQLATILFAGLGGAILGLSTLSFYGRPQDKLANIAIGFAVGVIVGTGYVTYKATQNPKELYGFDYLPEYEQQQLSNQLRLTQAAPMKASYTFSF